jgi:hypothetical protein
MAAMSQEQLEGMYCRSSYPEYVRALVQRRAGTGTLGPEDAYQILRTRRDGFVSRHLCGGAVDIDPNGLDLPLLGRILEEHGFAVLDERSLGVDCLHASYRAGQLEVVRD